MRLDIEFRPIYLFIAERKTVFLYPDLRDGLKQISQFPSTAFITVGFIQNMSADPTVIS
jgi:hypothetical protein